jgi:hypothetical protein
MNANTQCVKQEVYQAIRYFIKRQQIVARAMVALGLDLEVIGQYGALAWVSSISSIMKKGDTPTHHSLNKMVKSLIC